MARYADLFDKSDFSFKSSLDDATDTSWSQPDPLGLHSGNNFLAPSSVFRPMMLGGSGTADGPGTSPTMASEIAFISGIDATGKNVATSYWTWNGDDAATYASSSDTHKWGSSTPGTAGGTISYYFDASSSWTATEKAQMTACLNLWSDIANIHFSLTNSASGADIDFVRGSDGGAYTNASWSGSGNAGVIGDKDMWTTSPGVEISLDTSVPGFGPLDGSFTSIGGYVWETIIHELGHALGLGHGGAYNGDVDSATQQFSAYDTRLWSLMSYIEPGDTSSKYYSQYTVTGTNWGTSSDGYGNDPTTPMPLDISAIQGIYGNSTSSAYSGGQTFGFNCNIADGTEEFYDFTKNVNPVVTLFDYGTGNRLDLSGYTTDSTINLNPGTFSSANGMTNNIGIAFGTAIDQAIGGSGADTFYANADADYMVGGGGADTFDMGADFRRDDRIVGGGGNNTMTVDGDYGTIVHFESDTVREVSMLVMEAGHDYSFIPADRNVAAGKTMTFDASALGSANVFQFNGFHELDGSYNLKGGAGNDILYGGKGHDLFTGNGGADRFEGQGGSNTYVYLQASDSTSTIHDDIFDFNASLDKIDVPFTVHAVSTVTHGTVTASNFDTAVATAATGLGDHDALLFTPDKGVYAGHVLLVIDVNGTAGYQAHADLVIDLEHATNIGSFSTANFV